jgi:transglutaminase-like putative cysteine protease
MLTLQINHLTEYRYKQPVLYSIQQVHLKPREEPCQQIIEWSIKAPAKPVFNTDHFGNAVCNFTINKSHTRLLIQANGIVTLKPLSGGCLPTDESRLHPTIFSKQTPLTTASELMIEFAQNQLQPVSKFEDKIMRLANAIADYVEYRSGSTKVSDTAESAFMARNGVCQDHAHIMLACLRACGYNARYVSGYHYSEHHQEFASHAWVDVYDPEQARWVSADATHRCLVEGQHCRLAIALDYMGAAPVRGVRSGGSGESLSVDVQINRLQDVPWKQT